MLISTTFAQGQDVDRPDIAKKDVDLFEAVVLKWIAALGTNDGKTLEKQMNEQRTKVIKLGEPAVPRVCELLKHKQVNIRRGSAIILMEIAEQQKVRDEKLLDLVLLRMVEDEDIKSRNNLYHVASILIQNQKLNNQPASAK